MLHIIGVHHSLFVCCCQGQGAVLSQHKIWSFSLPPVCFCLYGGWVPFFSIRVHAAVVVSVADDCEYLDI